MVLARLRAPAVAFLIVFAARALVALTRWDELRGEEIYNSTLAVALLEGLDLRRDQIPVIDHLRGSAVFGFLLVPMIAVTRAPFLCLKLLACLWSGLTAALLSYALERGVGRRAAYLGAVLFALLPPSFVIIDVLALGSHGDTVVFLACALACLAGCPAGADIGWRRAGLLGLACGGSVLFSMHGLISLPAVLLAWLVLDPRFALRRSAFVFVVAMAVAVVPTFLLSPSADVQAKPLSSLILPDGPGGAFLKLGKLLSFQFRRSLLFEEHGGAWLSWIFIALALSALPDVLRRIRRRDPLAVLALAYPVLLLGAFAAMNFELNLVNTTNGIGSRYLMPLLPFVSWWVLLSGEELVRAGRRVLGFGQVALLCAVGAISVASYLDPGTAFRSPRLRGVDFSQFRGHVQHAAGPAPLARLELVHALDPEWEEWQPLTHDFIAPPQPMGLGGFEGKLRAVREAPPELMPFLATALGRSAARSLQPEVWAALVARLPPDGQGRAWFLRGAGAELLLQAGEEESVAQWLENLELCGLNEQVEAMVRTLLAGKKERIVGRWLRSRAERGEADAVEAWLRDRAERGSDPGLVPRLRADMESTLADRLAALPPGAQAEVGFGAGFHLGTVLSPYNRMPLVLLEDVAGGPAAGLRGDRGVWWESFFRGFGSGYRIRFDEERYRVPDSGGLSIERRLPEAARPAFRAGLEAAHD